jgi:hypothetical protein
MEDVAGSPMEKETTYIGEGRYEREAMSLNNVNHTTAFNMAGNGVLNPDYKPFMSAHGIDAVPQMEMKANPIPEPNQSLTTTF